MNNACCRSLADLLNPKFFKALCDVNRLVLLARLSGRGVAMTVGQIALEQTVDVSVTSRHLAALRDVGILKAERKGKEVYYSVNYDGVIRTLREIADSIEACCPPETEDDKNACAQGAKKIRKGKGK